MEPDDERVLGLLLVAIGVLMIRKPLLGERTLINKGVYRYDLINACPGNNAIISYGPRPLLSVFWFSPHHITSTVLGALSGPIPLRNTLA